MKNYVNYFFNLRDESHSHQYIFLSSNHITSITKKSYIDGMLCQRHLLVFLSVGYIVRVCVTELMTEIVCETSDIY